MVFGAWGGPVRFIRLNDLRRGLRYRILAGMGSTGGLFSVLALLEHKRVFASHKILGLVFHVTVALGAAVLVFLCGLIGTKFHAQGKPDLDYIIVLGAQVRENGPSIILQYRLDTAIAYLKENEDTLCIVSGGQGANEPFSEAEGMKRYLIENGVEPTRILLEDQSSNTTENIRYSKELLGETYENVGIVTNDFHVFRGVWIANMQKLKGVCGIAAPSNVWYLPNNILRECLGILKTSLQNLLLF